MRHVTFLSCLVALAGGVSSVHAQQTFTIEARLVVDGEAGAPTGAFVDTFLPGPKATRVGLTVQARIRQNTTFSPLNPSVIAGNFGIGGVQNPDRTNLARFTHNDTPSSSGGYQPFARARTGTALGADGRPLAGAFGQEGGRDFRATLDGVANGDWNTERTNAPGADSFNRASTNGFFPATGQILSTVSPIVNPLSTALGTTPLFSIGEFSPWYNLYRIYFDPVPSAAAQRLITVSYFGRFLGAIGFFASPVPSYLLGNAPPVSSGALQTTISATFQVPAPGAAGLIALAAIAAGRRRR